MSLATRCTSCATVFRVVQDQLKVSEGWVRCGRCGTVFNALDALFDLNPGHERTPSSSSHSAPAGRVPQEGKNQAPARNKETSDSSRKKPSEPEPPPHGGRSDFVSALFSPRLKGPKALVNGPSAINPETSPKSRKKPPRQLPPGSYEIDKTIIAGTESITDTTESHQPATLEFVRLADQKAKWAQPRIQKIVISSIACLILILLMQVGHHFRDITAAKWPETAPLLLRWCRLLNCQLQAPRHIDSVVVESVSLTRGHSSSNKFLLSVVLQNRNAFAVAMPALDLTLRENNGALITRRILKPEDLQLKTITIEPRSEAQVQVVLTEKERRIVNYTVEAFYP